MQEVTRTTARVGVVLCLGLGLSVAACMPHIAPYSSVAYAQATSLKAKSLSVLEKATTPYEEHRAEVDELALELAEAYEFAKGRPKNEISTRQWAVIRDPDKHLVGGVLERWRAEGRLSASFVAEMRGQVADAFDTVIRLEAKKIED